jgi:hypothetical protein
MFLFLRYPLLRRAGGADPNTDNKTELQKTPVKELPPRVERPRDPIAFTLPNSPAGFCVRSRDRISRDIPRGVLKPPRQRRRSICGSDGAYWDSIVEFDLKILVGSRGANGRSFSLSPQNAPFEIAGGDGPRGLKMNKNASGPNNEGQATRQRAGTAPPGTG